MSLTTAFVHELVMEYTSLEKNLPLLNNDIVEGPQLYALLWSHHVIT